MSKGDIVLVYFPFTDLKGRKLRPALVLYEGKRDIVLAFISSRLEKYDPKTSVIIRKEDPGFEETGLKVSSIIRLDKIATIHKSLVAGKIGTLPQHFREKVNKKIKTLLTI